MTTTAADPASPPQPAASVRPALSITGFFVAQAVLAAAVGGATTYRLSRLSELAALPPLRAQPLSIAPLYDYDVVISDEQLRRVLGKLVPRYEGDRTRLNHVDHALRFWGLEAKFDNPDLMSGESMRQILTDQRRFALVYGDQTPPLLIDEDSGVRVRVQEGDASSSHVDHTMATLAEVGTPLDFPLVTSTRKSDYRAMVEQALGDFALNQVEYEWTAMTLAMLLPPGTAFISKEGQRIDFNLLAERIMRQHMPQGVCFGNHRLYALVLLLRVDDEHKILAASMRQRIMDYLRGMTARLVEHQHPDGFWNANWPYEKPPRREPAQDGETDRVSDRILATGHALEWWAMAPSELHPPRHVLAAAGQWLVRTIDELSDEQAQEYFTFLSHAGRALALWRNRAPASVVH